MENLHQAGIRFGQPTQFTHPHLLKQNELTIGLQPNEFADRRRKLMEKITKHCVDTKKPLRNIVSSIHFEQTHTFVFFVPVSIN